MAVEGSVAADKSCCAVKTHPSYYVETSRRNDMRLSQLPTTAERFLDFKHGRKRVVDIAGVPCAAAQSHDGNNLPGFRLRRIAENVFRTFPTLAPIRFRERGDAIKRLVVLEESDSSWKEVFAGSDAVEPVGRSPLSWLLAKPTHASCLESWESRP